MTDVDFVARPGLRGRGTAVLVVNGGLVVGVGDYLLQNTLLGYLTNSVATWAALAFLIGALVAAPAGRAVLPAGTSLAMALAAWYAVAQALYGLYTLDAAWNVLVWLVGAVLAGAVFGIAGSWWRWQRDSWRAGAGLAVLVALFVADGGRALLVTTGVDRAAVATPIVAGTLLQAVLGRSVRRRSALLLTLPLAAAGVGGHAVLEWALALGA